MKRRIPSLNWLRVFEAAARTQSFARAAELLNMSPAAVSQQIKSLEGYTGKPLFLRGAHDVKLTDAGRAFWPTVSDALASVEIRAATLFGTADTVPLTIRATQILTCSWLSALLPEFRKEHPGINVHLLSDSATSVDAGDDVELKIVFGEADAGWTHRDLLFGERLYPVARPEVCREIEAAADLSNFTLIEIADHRAGWFRLYDSLGIDPDDARFTITDRTDLALALSAGGYGIALARAPATDVIVKRYGLEPCLPDVEVPGVESYFLSCRSTESLSDAAVAFRSWLLEKSAKCRD
ncbi:MAG: LysR family transcriptional regulator [Pseudomonadota bacterium]